MKFFHWQKQTLHLHVYVQPRASKSEIVGVHGDYLKVRIQAAPVEGQANAALIKFFSDFFGVSKRQVSILQGDTGRIKHVVIEHPRLNLDLF